MFPYKFERIPMISKRKLEAEMNDPCRVDVKKMNFHGYLCENVAMTPLPRLPSRQRCVLRSMVSHIILMFCFSVTTFL